MFVIGNDTFFIKSYQVVNRRYSITFTSKENHAQCFADKQAAQFEAEALQLSTRKIFIVEELPAAGMANGFFPKGTLVAILIIFLASCSPKIAQYKVIQVNGQRFKVEGKRATFIAPKDSVVVVGQMVPVKRIF